MKTKTLVYNARIYTQSSRLIVDSMAVSRGTILAVGNNLQHDPDYSRFEKINLKGRTVVPGLVDAHTHLYFYAVTLSRISLQGLTSMDACQRKIAAFAAKLKKGEWLVGEGYFLDSFKKRVEPNRDMLDRVSGDRPAFIYSKDQHTAWVNSRALERAGIGTHPRQPRGGWIDVDDNGVPTGLLREGPAIDKVYNLIPEPSKRTVDTGYRKALEIAYRNGVTGVHSFDGPDGFRYFSELAEKGRLGLRINYYQPAAVLPHLHKVGIHYGVGTDMLRIAGVKVFADGSLGSQTAYCFNQYPGRKGHYGIETMTVAQMKKIGRSAARLGLPCAIHAIGDRAVANVLEAFESLPKLKSGARHRIEHLQMVRRKDIARVKRLNVVASMQPSHCLADIDMVRKYWGARGRNAYIFRTLNERGVDLAFGSDCPIEPLQPLAGIAAAVRRARPKSRDVFYPEERLTAEQALYHYTVSPAVAVSQQHCRGYLLPGYPADFVVLSDDITSVAASQLEKVRPLATVLGGKVMFCDKKLNL